MSLRAFGQLKRDWEFFGIGRGGPRRSLVGSAAVAAIVIAGTIVLAWSPWSPFRGEPPVVATSQPIIVNASAAELLHDLEQSTPVVGLEFDDASPTMPSPRKRLAQLRRWNETALRGRNELLAAAPRVASLPFLGDDECHIAPDTLQVCRQISESVRRIQPTFGKRVQSTAVSQQLMKLLDDQAWKRPEAVGTIAQIFQIENDQVRTRLVDYLATIEGPEAGKALVDRAVFDLNPEVRGEAVKALANRPLAGYREHLLTAFRHPWPAASRHAADAVVKLQKPELVFDLQALAKQPDPSLAVKTDGGAWMQTELVRVNHLANCLLCHPTTNRERTPVSLVAAMPLPDRALPEDVYGVMPTSEPVQEVLVDIVYLRQDFSQLHVTHDYEPWPVVQRFDYFRRTRPATQEEIARAESAARESGGKPTSYPQRDAVLAALARLKPDATQTAAR